MILLLVSFASIIEYSAWLVCHH